MVNLSNSFSRRGVGECYDLLALNTTIACNTMQNFAGRMVNFFPRSWVLAGGCGRLYKVLINHQLQNAPK